MALPHSAVSGPRRTRLAAAPAGLGALCHDLRAEDHEPGIAPEAEEFADWSVSCDNTRRCGAIGASHERAAHLAGDGGEAAMLSLRVTRESGRGARPRIFVDRRVRGAAPAGRSGALSLHILYPDAGDRTGRAYRPLPVKDGQQELAPAMSPPFSR